MITVLIVRVCYHSSGRYAVACLLSIIISGEKKLCFACIIVGHYYFLLDCLV